MNRTPVSLLSTFVLTLMVTCSVRAQESEQLPMPKQKQPAPVAPFYIPYAAAPQPMVVPWTPPPMHSREGWIYFAPNYMGQMRPRVIMSPYGSYYLYSGQPFYGVSSGRGYILPMTTGGN